MKESIISLLIMVIMAGIHSFLFAACSPIKPSKQSDSYLSDKSNSFLIFDHSHSEFDFLLKKNVHKEWVNYEGFLSETELFARYVDKLGNVESHVLATWTREQKLAFWINAYNAFTLKAIMERYPIRGRSLIGLFFPRNSILQIPGIWSRIKFKAGGKKVTLGQIEHKIIRKLFDEPRIHFAIVCASRSCANLRPEAYRANILEKQLHEQAVQFINDPSKGVRWDRDNHRLYISKVFKWFKKDFEKKDISTGPSTRSIKSNQPVLRFIRQYIRNKDVIDWIDRSRDIRVSYLPYDWRLNNKAKKLRLDH